MADSAASSDMIHHRLGCARALRAPLEPLGHGGSHRQPPPLIDDERPARGIEEQHVLARQVRRPYSFGNRYAQFAPVKELVPILTAILVQLQRGERKGRSVKADEISHVMAVADDQRFEL